ncbi:MAG TPA: nuclear transport factor 2 family protein [Gemmatimonadaceae bacterium]
MRRLLTCATLLLALAAPPLVAQQKTATAAELIRLENQWTTGLVKRDRALFEKLLAPKFVYTENDQLMSRADVIHEVAEGSDRVTAAHNEGMVVHEFAPNAAAVTGWLIVNGKGKSGAFTHRYRFTDTWVKGDQGWQIVAAQDYLAPK